MNAISSRRFSETILAHIVLTEAVIEPTLISSASVILVAILLVSRVIVKTRIVLLVSGMLFIPGPTLMFLISFGTCKISIFPKLIITHKILLNIQFTLIFSLFDSLFCINRWEWNIFIFEVESEHRYCPIALFVVPFWSLVQFVQFIFGQEDTHNFVTEFYSLLLTSNNIKKLRLLLLMLMSKISNFGLCSFVLLSKFLHDFSHAVNFLLQTGVITLYKEHFFILFTFLIK